MFYWKTFLGAVMGISIALAVFGFPSTTAEISAPIFAIIAATFVALTLLPLNDHRTRSEVLDFFLNALTVIAALLSGWTWLDSANGLEREFHLIIAVVSISVVVAIFATRVAMVLDSLRRRDT